MTASPLDQHCLEHPDHPCYGLDKAREIEERYNADTKKNTETHREIFDRLRMLEIDQAETKTQYGHIMETLGAIKSDVAELKGKPGKRWDNVVDKIIFAAVGAVVAYFLAGGNF